MTTPLSEEYIRGVIAALQVIEAHAQRHDQDSIYEEDPDYKERHKVYARHIREGADKVAKLLPPHLRKIYDKGAP